MNNYSYINKMNEVDKFFIKNFKFMINLSINY